MRIEDCGPALRSLKKPDRDRLVRYLRSRGLLRGRIIHLHGACVSARLCQADLVLALLRLNVLDVVERLIGKPITRFPAQRHRRGTLRPGLERRELVIAVRKPDPVENGKRRLLGTGLYERLSRARVGMSVEIMMSRGITRRDVRIGLKRGYLRMST